jgi:hypothetical protein
MEYHWKDAEQYKKLYDEVPTYGNTGAWRTKVIKNIILQNNMKSVWDFGCGRNYGLIKSLRKELPDISITGYDPSIVDINDGVTNIVDESHSDMVVSMDCLEHLYEDELPQCFSIFQAKTPRYIYLDICTRIAGRILPDGTNAHKTVQPANWWGNLIENEFRDYTIEIYAQNKLKDHIEIGLKKIETS